MNAPVAINRRTRNRRPRITGVSGGITIKHREYIGELNGSTTFTAQSYQLQPGLSQSFPWLSGIANNFEKYKMHSIKLCYVNVSATSERGRVTMAFDRDPLDSDPTSKIDLFSYNGAVEGAVWSPLELTVPVDKDALFTRRGLISGTDLKTYDMGKLVVASSNNADTSIVGELFLEYNIELMIPQPASCPSAAYHATSGVSKTAIFGTTLTQAGTFPATVTSSSITFHSTGYYAMSIQATGTAPGDLDPAGSTITIGPATETKNGDGSTHTTHMLNIHVTEPNQVLTAVYTGTSVSETKWIISMIDSDAYGITW
jgi:hypothetical protein